MKREIIRIENDIVRIPQSIDIWMTQHQLADLFQCFVAKINTNVRAILKTGVFEVPFDADLDALLPLASAAMRKVEADAGVLVLTDLYGASPSNLAARLAQLGTPVRRVSALSLPMLLRVMNYPEQGLDQLTATAAAGARNGAIIDDA